MNILNDKQQYPVDLSITALAIDLVTPSPIVVEAFYSNTICNKSHNR